MKKKKIEKPKKENKIKSINEKLWNDFTIEELESREELSPAVPLYLDPGDSGGCCCAHPQSNVL
jgi:hypothetical protein